jgi:hypothetical protein
MIEKCLDASASQALPIGMTAVLTDNSSVPKVSTDPYLPKIAGGSLKANVS